MSIGKPFIWRLGIGKLQLFSPAYTDNGTQPCSFPHCLLAGVSQFNMLNFNMLNSNMLNFNMLNFNMLNFDMLNFNMLNLNIMKFNLLNFNMLKRWEEEGNRAEAYQQIELARSCKAKLFLI